MGEVKFFLDVWNFVNFARPLTMSSSINLVSAMVQQQFNLAVKGLIITFMIDIF